MTSHLVARGRRSWWPVVQMSLLGLALQACAATRQVEVQTQLFPLVPTCESAPPSSSWSVMSKEEALHMLQQQGVFTGLISRKKGSGIELDAAQHRELVEAGLGQEPARLLALAMGSAVDETRDISPPRDGYYACDELLAAAETLSERELAYMMWGADQPMRAKDFECLQPRGERYRLTVMAEHYTLCP